MVTVDTRTIGPYAAGEIPPTLTMDFYDSSPPSLAGWTLALTCERDGVELTSWGSIGWSDATIARATITMPVLALATGKTRQQFILQAWAGNLTQRIASVRVCFFVEEPVGTTPAV
ncbi:MAG: hypothetical protein V2A79_01945 [Planctomycetota bacterium]